MTTHGDNVLPKRPAVHYYLQSCQLGFFAKHLAGLTGPDVIRLHMPFAQVNCQFNPPYCFNPYNVGVNSAGLQ